MSGLLRWLPVPGAAVLLVPAVWAVLDGRGPAWAVAFGIGAVGMGVAAVPAFARRRKQPSVQCSP